MCDRLFDPLAFLNGLNVRVWLDGSGQVHADMNALRDGLSRNRGRQLQQAQVVLKRCEGLLRVQLEGERPRSVMKLVALGVIKIVDGRYMKA